MPELAWDPAKPHKLKEVQPDGRLSASLAYVKPGPRFTGKSKEEWEAFKRAVLMGASCWLLPEDGPVKDSADAMPPGGCWVCGGVNMHMPGCSKRYESSLKEARESLPPGHSIKVTRTDWAPCPVCGEPDMRREVDSDGGALIRCSNHACLSNGGPYALPRVPAYGRCGGCGAGGLVGHVPSCPEMRPRGY